MNLKDIALIVDGTLHGESETQVQWLLTDSRSLSFPEETIFFAITTSRNDGHLYIRELYNKGVRSFVVTAYETTYKELKNANFIVVPNVLFALQQLAAYHRNKFSIPIIGITGSNGKTVVKEWLYSLLHEDYNITRSPGSYNSQIGVPLSVWQLNEHTELGIFEVGISLPDEMDRLEPIVQPTIGVFTHIGEAHQENFVSQKEKCLEKLKLFKHSDTLIYCLDNKQVNICVEQSGYREKKFTWGYAPEANIQVLEIKQIDDKTEIFYSFAKKKLADSYTIPFLDEASIENSLQCLTALLLLGISPKVIRSRMLMLQPVAMRLELKRGINNCLIINDSYNSDLNSLSIALDFLDRQAMDKNLKKTLILSDISQTGLPIEQLYQTVVLLIKNRGIQHFIGIGKEISTCSNLFSAVESDFFLTTQDFLASKLLHNFNNEAIMLKGGRRFSFEKISNVLELVAHQTILEVNLNALLHNFNYFRSHLKPETKIMCMVKAHAYGSGAAEVSRTLQQNRCDYLAVAVTDEGVELRNEGIHIPVVVMNPEQHSFGLIFEHNLEPEIYSFRLLNLFLKEAEKQGVTNYPVHIKIDTGMHRLGFGINEIDELIALLKNQSFLKIRSVFSHLAGSDENCFDDFTEQQMVLFDQASTDIQKAFDHKILRHILNSAGIERFSQYQYDMVRLGIGLYGVSAKDNQLLQNVCTLKTTILQVKEVAVGETIGYARKGVARQKMRIAMLPIGYADGYNRRLSNGVGKVMINGKLADVVGNICMDLTIVDVTDIADAKEGDVVEVFGNQLSISKLADWLGTIPYEILTNVSRRVKRVYFQE